MNPLAVETGGTVTSCLGKAPQVLELEATAFGYFEIEVKPTPTGYAKASITTSGRAVVSDRSPQAGGPVRLWFSSDAKQSYQLTVEGSDVANASFDAIVTFVAVVDPVPNDNKTAPVALAKNTPTHAYFFAGFKDWMNEKSSDYDHWFRVTLAAGAFSVRLDEVPADELIGVELFDSTGNQQLRLKHPLSFGDDVVLNDNVAAGTYLVKINNASAGRSDHGSNKPLPKSYTKPYRLTVIQ